MRETEVRLVDGQSKKLMTTYFFHGTQVFTMFTKSRGSKCSRAPLSLGSALPSITVLASGRQIGLKNFVA